VFLATLIQLSGQYDMTYCPRGNEEMIKEQEGKVFKDMSVITSDKRGILQENQHL
jgi:hypothetical protein